MLQLKKAYYQSMMNVTQFAGLKEHANGYKFLLAAVKVNLDVEAYRKQFAGVE